MVFNKPDRSLYLLVFITLWFTLPLGAQAKAAAPTLQNQSADDWHDAANKWRLATIDLQTQIDPVTSSIRSKRNEYWLNVSQKFAPGAMGFGAALAPPFQRPEFQIQPGDVWAIATFDTFRVFPTDADLRYAYTELVFRIDRLFKAPADLSLSVDSLIDVDMAGGRLRSATGRVVSDRLRPERYSLKPGHKYLMQFRYDPNGQFFHSGQYWDVTSGRVVLDTYPDSPIAQQNSSIKGMALPELIERFPSILENQPKR